MSGIHRDPVELAVRSGDVAVEAGGDGVAELPHGNPPWATMVAYQGGERPGVRARRGLAWLGSFARLALRDEPLQLGRELLEDVGARLTHDRHRGKARGIAAWTLVRRIPGAGDQRAAGGTRHEGHVGDRASASIARVERPLQRVGGATQLAGAVAARLIAARIEPEHRRGAVLDRGLRQRETRARGHALAVGVRAGAPGAARAVALIQRGAERQARHQRLRKHRIVEEEAQTPGALGDLLAFHGRAVLGTDGILCVGRRGGESGGDDKPEQASASHAPIEGKGRSAIRGGSAAER